MVKDDDSDSSETESSSARGSAGKAAAKAKRAAARKVAKAKAKVRKVVSAANAMAKSAAAKAKAVGAKATKKAKKAERKIKAQAQADSKAQQTLQDQRTNASKVAKEATVKLSQAIAPIKKTIESSKVAGLDRTCIAAAEECHNKMEDLHEQCKLVIADNVTNKLPGD